LQGCLLVDLRLPQGHLAWRIRRAAPPALLVASLRIEGQPDNVAGIRNVAARYHTSFPSGPPHSLSSWRFFGVMRRTSSSSV
jgi:hypothetical protein